eukprot:7216523-Alexandrium_andersonii.AAC.1
MENFRAMSHCRCAASASFQLLLKARGLCRATLGRARISPHLVHYAFAYACVRFCASRYACAGQLRFLLRERGWGMRRGSWFLPRSPPPWSCLWFWLLARGREASHVSEEVGQ